MSLRPSPPVLWREGMFFLPHHLQCTDARVEARVSEVQAAIGPFRWGISKLRVDFEALKTGTFLVEEAVVTTPVGTTLHLPNDTLAVEGRDIGELLKTRGEVLVKLGVAWRGAGGNLADPAHPHRAFAAEEDRAVCDDNDGSNPQTIERKRWNARVLVDGESDGFDCVPLMMVRAERTGRPSGVPSENYIPPVLSWRTVPELRKRIESVVADLNKGVADYGASLLDRSFAPDTPQDALRLMKLQTAAQLATELEQRTSVDEMHPFEAYIHLCRIVAGLSVFRLQETGLPKFKLYEHENLLGIFDDVCVRASEVTKAVLKVAEGHHRPFIPSTSDPKLVEAECPKDWALGTRHLYLRVRKPRDPGYGREQTLELLGQNFKLAPSSLISGIAKGGNRRGIDLKGDEETHFGLPNRQAYYYFRLSREKTDFWALLGAESKLSGYWIRDNSLALTMDLFREADDE